VGWLANDPLSTDYYEIIIPNPTYTTHRLIVAPFISYSIQPFKAEVSATYGKGYPIITHTLTPTHVPYPCVPTTPVHIALLNTTPTSDAIQSVINTHFPTHLSAAFKCYCHFQEQKYTTQGRIQRLKDRIASLQELENNMMEKATCVLSEMEDANFWDRLFSCNNQVLHQLATQPIAADTFIRTTLSFKGTYTQSALNPQPNPWRHAPGLNCLYNGACNCAYENDHRHCTHALSQEQHNTLTDEANLHRSAAHNISTHLANNYQCRRNHILTTATNAHHTHATATIAAPITQPLGKICFRCNCHGHIKKHCPNMPPRFR
jgi:hypothetical protein